MSQAPPKILAPSDSTDLDDLNHFVLLKYGEVRVFLFCFLLFKCFENLTVTTLKFIGVDN